MKLRKTSLDHLRDAQRKTDVMPSNDWGDTKSGPKFDFDETLTNNSFLQGLLRGGTHENQSFYSLFRRWTYAAISAICRRLGDFEWCAGDIVGGTPNPERSTKKWEGYRNEGFKRYRLGSSDLKHLPKHVRHQLGPTKAPSSTIDLLDEHPSLDMLNKPNRVQRTTEI